MNTPDLTLTPKPPRRVVRRRWGWVLGASALAVAALLAGFGIRLVQAARTVEAELRLVQEEAAHHNDRALLGEIPDVREGLITLRDRLVPFRPLAVLPGIGPYVRTAWDDDTAGLWIVRAVMPLRPALGGLLDHQGAVGPLLFLLHLPLAPSAHALRNAARLAAVRPPAWPKSLGLLYQERDRLRRAAATLTVLARDASPLRGALGVTRPARYLVMFQDGGELRATGGFYSAWALLTVHHGLLAPVRVEGISSVTRAAHYTVPAPFPIRWAFHYQTVSLMDSNFSPNAPTSIRRLERYVATIPGMPHVNGVILVDTWMLEKLLQVLGPVTVPVGPGSELTVSDANTEYTVVYVAEKLHASLGGRKQFLTPLADTLLTRAKDARQGTLGADSHAIWSRVVETILDGLNEEHLVLFVNNPRVEALLERAGWAGSMPAPLDQNFLEVVDTNYGGLKDNAYMTERAEVAMGPKIRGRVAETVTVRLTLDEAANGWMVGAYNGFVSAYFPPGTVVLDVYGAPMKPVSEVTAADNPRAEMAGATIQFPAATKSHPGTGVVTFRVLLPKGLPAFPLTVGKQPGLPGLTLAVSGGDVHIQLIQTTGLRVLQHGRHPQVKALQPSRPPL